MDTLQKHCRDVGSFLLMTHLGLTQLLPACRVMGEAHGFRGLPQPVERRISGRDREGERVGGKERERQRELGIEMEVGKGGRGRERRPTDRLVGGNLRWGCGGRERERQKTATEGQGQGERKVGKQGEREDKRLTGVRENNTQLPSESTK